MNQNLASNLSRRTFLRGAGVIFTLPWMESLLPPGARAASSLRKYRMVAINVGLGMHTPNFFPKGEGSDYELPIYLEPLAELRDAFTVISGSSLPGVDGGHHSEKSFLTGVPHPTSASFRNNISLDQFAAEKMGDQTRFSYLALSLASRGLSWSRSGVEIPTDTRPSALFAKLFLEGKPDEKARQLQRLKDGRSIMDTVLGEAKGVHRRLGRRDQEKLDQYMAAVRDTELRLHKSQEWENRPKPQVDAKPPQDINDSKDILSRSRLMYEVMHLALATDSTRLITFFKNGFNAVPTGIAGVDTDYHMLSHHGREEAKIAQLTLIELGLMKELASFLSKLRETQDGEASLLDQTMVLFGSNLGNASAHTTTNMPILLAGGGFKHGRHLAFKGENDYPLSNLHVSMLQRLGIETDTFSSGKGTMTGLEMV